MSARLGYPLPSPTPDANASSGALETEGRGSVEVADLESPQTSDAAGEDSGGTWLGRLRPNKYGGSIGDEGLGGLADLAEEETLRIAAAAGLPYFTPARLAEIAAEYGNDPRLDTLKTTLANAHRDPKHTGSRAWQLAQDMARGQGKGTQDVWSLLVLALRHALIDQGAQLSYTLDRLQMYAAMGQQMSKYGAVLQDAQRALDAKLATESAGKADKMKQAFAEVPFIDNREYDAESFFALGPDGELYYKQTAATPAPAPAPEALQAKEAKGYKPLWKMGFGARQQHFTTADGKTWLAHGSDEAARRADAVKQIVGKNQETADKANLISATGLGLKVQNYTQQREQLQKLTDKWQTRFQLDHESKNQTASAITSVLKNLHDMQSQITRNLQ